jgi:hypothetical protein
MLARCSSRIPKERLQEAARVPAFSRFCRRGRLLFDPNRSCVSPHRLQIRVRESQADADRLEVALCRKRATLRHCSCRAHDTSWKRQREIRGKLRDRELDVHGVRNPAAGWDPAIRAAHDTPTDRRACSVDKGATRDAGEIDRLAQRDVQWRRRLRRAVRAAAFPARCTGQSTPVCSVQRARSKRSKR